MNCSRCGKDMGELQKCDQCGWSEHPPNTDGKAIASLILGIISLLFCGACLILPIIGLVLGISAKKSNSSGAATAGIILNAAALILALIAGFLFCLYAFVFDARPHHVVHPIRGFPELITHSGLEHIKPLQVPPQPFRSGITIYNSKGEIINSGEQKMTPNEQRLIPFLTFAGNAEEAMHFYADTLPGAKIESLSLFEEGQRGDPGKVLTGILSFMGQQIMFLDIESAAQSARPGFSWSTSLFLDCKDESEFDAVFAALSQEGIVMMGPEPVLHFRKVAWVTDKFGVTWQPVWK